MPVAVRNVSRENSGHVTSQRDKPRLVKLGIANANMSLLEIDIGHIQADRLASPKRGAVHQHDQGVDHHRFSARAAHIARGCQSKQPSEFVSRVNVWHENLGQDRQARG
jgi:hypothetical protein